MKNTTIISILLVSIAFISCKKKESPNAIPETATLLFSSGFAGDVYIDETVVEDNLDYKYIRGTDSETGYSWPITVLGATESGLHYVDDDDFKAVESEIQTVIGHNGTPTKALFVKENYNTESTQLPYEILNIKEGKKDLYIKFWIKLDSASLFAPNMWRTFFEWKSMDYGKGGGFRLISYIYTDADGVPYWHWQGDRKPNKPKWEIDNKTIPVPINEWFKTEFYWHWSEGDDGRALWRINDQVVGDHYGPTAHRGKPVDFIMLGQIYGSQNPKHQWIDDIEIWNSLPD